MKKSLVILLAASMPLLGGCIEQLKPETLKPWDRNLLAEDKMQLVADPIDDYMNEHIFFSKEASHGGQGVGGGGCGCN